MNSLKNRLLGLALGLSIGFTSVLIAQAPETTENNFETPPGGVAGSTGQVQYNNGGVAGGIGEGTATDVLTSNGPGVPPSFQAGGGGGGAPTTATYITQTANASLSNEQALGALATGMLKNTTTTGVLSIGVLGTDYGNVVGQASSVDNELALFSSTGGKTIKRASTSGIPLLISGVLSTAVAGTDYYAPGGTDVAFADGGTGLSAAADDTVLVSNSTAWQAKALTDCDDTSGNHLNYDTTTNVFSCGTSNLSGITGLANPSASLGLTAVNGSATTAMRSDGAPALDQSISPTWTGTHVFSSTVPTIRLYESDQALNAKVIEITLSNGTLAISPRNDDFTGGSNTVTLTRAGALALGGAATAASFGATSATAPVTGIGRPGTNRTGFYSASLLRGEFDANGTFIYNVGSVSAGTKFTASGCSNSTTVGGATAGQFASGTTGTCTVTITLPTAANGWACHASDITTPANLISQSAVTTTSCTITGTTVSGDTIVFSAHGY